MPPNQVFGFSINFCLDRGFVSQGIWGQLANMSRRAGFCKHHLSEALFLFWAHH